MELEFHEISITVAAPEWHYSWFGWDDDHGAWKVWTHIYVSHGDRYFGTSQPSFYLKRQAGAAMREWHAELRYTHRIGQI